MKNWMTHKDEVEYSAEMSKIWGWAPPLIRRRRKGAKGQHDPHVYTLPQTPRASFIFGNDKTHQFAVITRAHRKESSMHESTTQ